MEWLNRMMEALNYIEINLEDSLYMEDIAKTACSSSFHFQRMFHMLTGLTVVEYIRKRRLTLAAQELASSSVKVIDVALKYGYDSPEAFSKAFKNLHGITPTAARGPGASLRAFPRISFQISLKGDKDMDYKIVERTGFQVVGKTLKVSTKDGEGFKRIPQFWSECNEDGTCMKICSLNEAQPVLGICIAAELEKEQFTYMAAVEKPEGDGEYKPFETAEIPPSTWAVFTSVGPMPGAIQKVWERIFQEWFPSTGYEHAGTPELEVYPMGDLNGEDYRCEVWIPIKKK